MEICQICKQSYPTLKSLFLHFNQKHKLSAKAYYDKFLKKEGEGMCCCGKDTRYKNLSKGYVDYCSIRCSSKNPRTLQKKRETKFKIYGDENYCNCKKMSETWKNKTKEQIDEKTRKRRETNIKKYGDAFYSNREGAKTTCQEIYGDKHYTNRDKYRETCIREYGVLNTFQLDEVKLKIGQSKIELYGTSAYTNNDKMIKTKALFRKENIENMLQWNKLNIRVVDVSNSEVYKFECLDCNREFLIDYGTYKRRIGQKVNLCTLCNPVEDDRSERENFIANILHDNGIQFEIEKRYGDCRNRIGSAILPFDFYISFENILIEYDGEHHFYPVDFSKGNMSATDLIKKFLKIMDNDTIKTKYCQDNNITLIRIPYWKTNEEIRETIHKLIS